MADPTAADSLILPSSVTVLVAQDGDLCVDNGDPLLFLRQAAANNPSIFNFNNRANSFWLGVMGL